MTDTLAGRRVGAAALRDSLARIPMPEGRVAVLVWSYLAIGAAVVVVTLATAPIDDAIAVPFSIAGIDPVVLGVCAWILVGLATYARGTVEEGRAAIMFGVAPVVAAFALGGPAAGVWVALIGSLELRELRGEIPWYGVLANHALLAIPAALGGFVVLGLRGLGLGEGELADFVVVMAGAAVFCAVNIVLALLAVWARTGRGPAEALGIPMRSLLTMMAAESTLAWIFAAAFVSIAWWSPIGLVLADAAASASIDRGRAGWLLRHHQLTQLPNRLSLTEHAADLRRAGRKGVCVFYIDLDGFKDVNDTYDHEVGDDVLRTIARRLVGARRRDDFLAHLHGDEFVLLAAGVEADTDARAIVDRVTRSVEEPIEHEVGTIRVSASVGYRILGDLDGLEEALRHADRGMAAAKRARAAATGRSRRHR